MTSLSAPDIVDTLGACRRSTTRTRGARRRARRRPPRAARGPPGTGKSTILREVAAAAGTGFVFVEGNAELTPAPLAGQFDRLVCSMTATHPTSCRWSARRGAAPWVAPLCRGTQPVPEETVNLLITVMSRANSPCPVSARSRQPTASVCRSDESVRQHRHRSVSGAVYDRMCRIAMGYQSLDDESTSSCGTLPKTIESCGAGRRCHRGTRNHPDVRVGSSVRGRSIWSRSATHSRRCAAPR